MTEAKRRLLAARAMGDVTAAQCAVVVRLADSLHIFAKLVRSDGMTSDDVSRKCGIPPRLASSILTTLAASGYIDFDRQRKTYCLSPEQQALFVNEDDPLFLGGAFQFAVGLARNDSAEMAVGISRSSRAKFPSLVARRLGARLETARRVVEIGCGSGGALIEIVRRYPNLNAVGIDENIPMIERARLEASQSSVADRVAFVAGGSKELAAQECDIVLCFEALHEFRDPVAVARAIWRALKPGGVWLSVEPVHDGIDEGNDARFLASLAALYCLPASGFDSCALGPLASKRSYERVLKEAGFEQPIIDTDGPIHVLIEATRRA